MAYLVGLECTACGTRYSADEPIGVCPACGLVLFARYDLQAVKAAMPHPHVDEAAWDLWRYRALLPVGDAFQVRSLGEGMTPLLPARSASAAVGLERGELWIKDEGRNPTGSFKARGLAVAVARAVELGVSDIALPSAGNAGAAAAAYAAAYGIRCHEPMPGDAPSDNQAEVLAYGAELILVDGLIDQAGSVTRERGEAAGWFDLSTMREPYRVEGKKTMAFELAEAGGWGDDWCPDVIVYPTGGGTGIVGMWKAIAEMAELGWIGARRPRFVVVQSSGCAPIVRAFQEGAEKADRWKDAATVAAGIRVPVSIGDYLILRAVRESGGTAVEVADEEIIEAHRTFASLTGIWPALEGAATWAALAQLRESGFLGGEERVVLMNTAVGLKSTP
jgi:threonine synthase